MASDMALSGQLGREQDPTVYMMGALRPLEFSGLGHCYCLSLSVHPTGQHK